MIKKGGKGRDRSWVMGNNERVMRLVMGNDERATRSVMGNDGADEIGFGWIGLRWLCDLSGGVRYMAAPVLGCDRVDQ